MKPGAALLAAGAALAPPAVRRTAYLRAHDAPSEAAAKEAARAAGRITWHIHIGLTDWDSTAAALREIEQALAEAGVAPVDRFGLAISRAMSLPPAERHLVPKETGPLLADDDWAALGEAATIQPHMGDFMVGMPAGPESAALALAAGATTIGNLAQAFSAYSAPPGYDDVDVAEATITAIGVLAAARAQGALLQFYLDDGQAMQARDYGAYVGWAALELHLAEALCGARLAHSWGGLVHVPRHRALVHLALDDLRRLTGSASLGSMIFGNTVDMRPRADLHNHSVIATSALVDIACQLRRPTGHAIHVTPLTEAERIPSAAENAEVQLLARGLEREARRSGDLFDWAALERDARALAEHGLRFKERALVLLADDGVDVQDPAALFLALRQTGLAELEQRCDLVVPAAIRALEPWKAGHVRAVEERLGATLPRLDGVRALLCVVDVHDVVRDALLRALPAAGCEVVLLPSDASPEAIAHAAVAEDVDGIVLGTYNGAALTLGRRLCSALDSEGWEGPVVIGGRLNEDDGGPLPVDVTDDLRALGLEPAHAVEDVGRALAASRA